MTGLLRISFISLAFMMLFSACRQGCSFVQEDAADYLNAMGMGLSTPEWKLRLEQIWLADGPERWKFKTGERLARMKYEVKEDSAKCVFCTTRDSGGGYLVLVKDAYRWRVASGSRLQHE